MSTPVLHGPGSARPDPAASIDQTRPLTIVGLKVDAYKRLRAAHVHVAPTGLVPVRGRNGQGKSSLLDSMGAAFFGAAASAEAPIHAGAPAARVEVDLGDLVVRRSWTRSSDGGAKTALVVENAAGAPQRSPQALLDGLCSRFADPVAFIALPPSKQVEVVLGLTGRDAELRALESAVEELYATRRDLGREADRAQKACDQLRVEVGLFRLDPPQDDPESLAAELAAADEHNRNLAEVRARMVAAEAGGRAARVKADRLRKELAQAEGELAVIAEEHRSCTAWLAVAPPETDLAPIKARMAQLSDYAAKRANLQTLARLEQDARARATERDQAAAALEARRAEVQALLAEAEFPVPGMSYDGEKKQLLVGGIPFSQASHAERLRISAAIAMSGSHPLRVVFIRDGSMLDQESLALVAQMAEERGYQVWCELVDSERDGAGVWIEDGEAFQPAAETAQS